MSIQLIQQYYSKVEQMIRYGGTRNESTLRKPFQDLLECYKEKKPKAPTVAEKFNTYRFSDYKEVVIELLGRVCAVSVRTMEIVREMPESTMDRGRWMNWSATQLSQPARRG